MASYNWVKVVEVMACHPTGAKPYPASNADVLSIGFLGQNSNKIWNKIPFSWFKRIHSKCRQKNGGHFVEAPIRRSKASFASVCTLQWRHNVRDDVSNHRRLDCLHNRVFRHRSKKTSKLRFTGLCDGNRPVTGGFPSQRASDAENVTFDDVIM